MERWVWNGEHAVPQVWNGVWNEMFKSTCSIPKRFDSWTHGHIVTRASLLGARTLLGPPGLTTRNKKLLGTKGIATRSTS